MRIVEKNTEAPSNFTSDQEKLPKGILARVTYPIMRFDQLNANQRIYSRKVGEAVLNDPDVKEKLQKRTLFGDQEHPTETQIRLDADKTSHVISNLYIDESDNTLKMDMDLLPTKAGKFLFTLLECGCQIGVSSRAEGDLEEAINEETGEKYFKVKPDTFKFSTVDATGDPSTPDVIPEKVINGVQKGYESHFIDRDIAIALLDRVNTPKAKQLRESIEKDSKKILKEVKEIKNTPPKSTKIIAESIVEVNGKKGIVNQVFQSTGKAVVQIGIERKIVSLSECKLVEGSVKEAAIKKGFYKTEAGEEVYVDNDEIGNGKVSLVTEKGQEYISVDEFMKMVDEKKILLDEKRLGESFVGFDSKPDGFVAPVKEDGHDDYVEPAPAEGAMMEDDPEPNGEGPSPEVTEPEVEGAEEVKKIEDFDTMEDMYDYVVQDVPALKDYDQEEVIKGLIHEQNHNEGEYDVLFGDVHKLANVVCTELSEVPDYYTRLEEMINNAKEDQPDEEVEAGDETADDQADVHPVDPQLFTPGMEEAVKQINRTRISEAILKAEKETLIEMATKAVEQIRNNYVTDVCSLTEKIESAKRLDEDIELLKNKINTALQVEVSLNEKLTVKESELVILNKKLVELQDTASAKAEDIAALNERLDEAQRIYKKNLVEAQIKMMAKVTGLKLDERSLTLLRECKSEDELVTKLEECRDQVARATLHSNIVTEVKIKTETPGSKNTMLESIGGLLDAMSGNSTTILKESN